MIPEPVTCFTVHVTSPCHPGAAADESDRIRSLGAYTKPYPLASADCSYCGGREHCDLSTEWRCVRFVWTLQTTRIGPRFLPSGGSCSDPVGCSSALSPLVLSQAFLFFLGSSSPVRLCRAVELTVLPYDLPFASVPCETPLYSLTPGLVVQPVIKSTSVSFMNGLPIPLAVLCAWTESLGFTSPHWFMARQNSDINHTYRCSGVCWRVWNQHSNQGNFNWINLL